MNKKVYNGLLCLHRCDEDHDTILFLSNIEEPLAEELSYLKGKNVTIRYYISDIKMTKEELDKAIINKLFGLADVDFGSNYSDYTGYLWTDEELKIGGHDLIEELKNNIDKWLYLEVEY